MKEILVINQYAGNKGDRAVLYALSRLILDSLSDVKITVSTTNPELWNNYKFYESKNIKFIPSAWDFDRVDGNIKGLYFKLINRFKKYTYTILRENYLSFKLPIEKFLVNPLFYRYAKKADLIISTGGHHYTTILSKDLVSHLPYELCSALSLNKNTLLFSQSVGPFNFENIRNKIFIKTLLSNCRNIYLREKNSFEYLNKFDVKSEHLKEVPETVLSLCKLFKNYKKPTNRQKKVGIAIYSTKKRTDIEKNNYVTSISDFCNFLINKHFKIEFFPMELKDTEPDDRNMIKQIMTNISDLKNCFLHDKDLETKEHIEAVARCRFFVGHKTHSVIFALASGTPLIAIEYHPKTKNFMKQFNLADYSINDDILTCDNLIKIFNNLESESDNIGFNSFSMANKFSKEIESNFQEIKI